jgi:hypothetical protein
MESIVGLCNVKVYEGLFRQRDEKSLQPAAVSPFHSPYFRFKKFGLINDK